MTKRELHIIPLTLLLLASLLCGIAHAEPRTPRRTGSGQTTRTETRKDSTEELRSMARTLIESVGELSKTANNLSESAMKLLEASGIGKEKEKTATVSEPVTVTPYFGTGDDLTPETQEEDSIPARAEAPAIFPFLAPPDEEGVQSEEAGSYVWVPKGKEAEVAALLAGKPISSTGPASMSPRIPDANEKVTFRGDTIPMVMRDRFKFGRYDRGLFNYLFIPKGTWHFSLTASYGEFSTADLEALDLLSDVSIGGRQFSIQPSIHYFIRNNISIGMRISYANARGYIDSGKVNFDEDINFSLKDIEYKSETYTAGIALTQYVGLTRKGRFGVSNELELNFASGNGDFKRPYGGELRRTHSTTMTVGVNFSPGVSIFIMKNVSFNLSFGVLGFKLNHEKQWENGEKTGDRTTSGIDLKFNIFNIKFGIGVHI